MKKLIMIMMLIPTIGISQQEIERDTVFSYNTTEFKNGEINNYDSTYYGYYEMTDKTIKKFVIETPDGTRRYGLVSTIIRYNYNLLVIIEALEGNLLLDINYETDVITMFFDCQNDEEMWSRCANNIKFYITIER